MAKQTGIHGLRGKVNGMSYYGSKVGGSLVRKINEGMSERVKTDKAYANTRKNNAEFGMCGDLAGALIKPFTIRWRFLLDSIATGKMVKALKEVVVLDSTHDWGKRVVGDTFFDQIRAKWNSFSKNEMLPAIIAELNNGVTYNGTDHEINLSALPKLSVTDQQEMLAEGINHIQVKVFGYRAEIPEFNIATNTYSTTSVSLVELPSAEVNSDISGSAEINLLDATDIQCGIDPVDGTNALGAFVIVVLPCRKVGNSISVLQEKCSAYMVRVDA